MDIEILNILKTKIIPTEQLVYCPFDQNHKIKGKRITAHITKCIKNQTDKKFKICPYHALHYVSPEYYSAHIFECPNKDSSDNEDNCMVTNGEENENTEQFVFESMKFLDTAVPKPLKKVKRTNINPFMNRNPYNCGLLSYMDTNPIDFFEKLSHSSNLNDDQYQFSAMELQNIFVSQSTTTPQMSEFLKQYFP